MLISTEHDELEHTERTPPVCATLRGVHVVALTRWGRPMESELAILAGWLGLTAYDLRLRLAGSLPAVLQPVPDASSAATLRDALRARGHGAVAVGLVEVAGPEAQRIPRSFALSPHAISGLDTAGRPFELAYVELLALLRASRVRVTERTVTSHAKKLDLGRAVLSGGLVVRKTVDTSTRHKSEELDQVRYVFGPSDPTPYLFSASTLRYEGLGPDLGVATLQNFQSLVSALRARAPRALYDERLLTVKRKASLAAVGGSATDRVVTESNASENDLAAALLVRALLEGQL